jgi:soluble lytic murein transglycosylase-like protein
LIAIAALFLIAALAIFTLQGNATMTSETPQSAALAPAEIRALIDYNNSYGFDPNRVMQMVYVESRYNPSARGAAGEIGLMQIKPSTARDMGFDPDTLTDPATNIACGMKYLAWVRDYLRQHTGREPSWAQILSGYNAGVGNVLRGYIPTAYIGANNAAPIG